MAYASNSNAYQVGGGHYQNHGDGLQHWDVMALLRANYFIGCSTKYLIRFEKKNGVEDLAKCVHFLKKAHEIGAPKISRLRLWYYKQKVSDWLHENYKESGFPTYLYIAIKDIFDGKYLDAANIVMQIMTLYTEATEPTKRYTNQ